MQTFVKIYIENLYKVVEILLNKRDEKNQETKRGLVGRYYKRGLAVLIY